ncbi:MAG: fibronectin type III domain-containing protein, partial [Thermoplasmata archaeon]
GVGSIALNKAHYAPTDTVEVSLYDTDLNTNPGLVESVQVNIRSSAEPAGEVVTLTEVGADEGVFKGTISLTAVMPSPGLLSVYSNDVLNATYREESPKGLRWVRAVVDGILPTISNVAVIPSVTTATITWKTNEETDSRVSYGLTTSLGSSEYEFRKVKSHSILLTNLNPSTRYYFEVASADQAGNQAVDDNGGSKYSFITLTGISSVPGYGYVGWVREEEPTGNHFTDPEIIVGYSHYRHTTYLGAAQFQVSPIPDSAIITNATVQFFGGRWIYNQIEDNWNLTLLNSSSDAGWVNHSYGDIESAGADAVLYPELGNSDLVEGEWNYFYFLPSQYVLLREHFNRSRISFRLSGRTSADLPIRGLIFAWVSGYESGSSFASPFSPRITVTYTLTGDILGPQISSLNFSRENGAGDPLLVLSARASDLASGNSNITNVEYFLGLDPGLGKGLPMAPLDGSFDSPVENCTVRIDVSDWSPGLYIFNVRGRDEAGNWGLAESVEVYIAAPLPPTNVDAHLEGFSFEHVNISWTLSGDDGQGDDDVVHYSIYYGSSYERSAGSYQYLASVPKGTNYYLHSFAGNGDPNSYFYAVLANESYGNARRAPNQAAKYARNLTAGIHLLSNPLSAASNDLETVLQTVHYVRAWWFNPASSTKWVRADPTKPYGRSFSVANNIAFWVEVSSDSTYVVAGRVPNNVTIKLTPGWNLVPYPSFIPRVVADTLLGIEYTRIEEWDPTSPPYHLRQMSVWEYMFPGRGYWIYATESAVWEVSN